MQPNTADLPCYPNAERIPGHEPQHTDPDLFAAMGALRDVLADLEADIADEETVREESAVPSRRIIADDLIDLWQRRHASLAKFFDADVYLDRAVQS